MQLKKQKMQKLNRDKIVKLLKQEDEYISNLMTTFEVPDSIYDKNIDELYLTNTKEKRLIQKFMPNTSKARPTGDSNDILEIMKNKHKNKHSKPSERTMKKRMEKKLKKDKQLKKRILSVTKTTKNSEIKQKILEDNKDNVKPVYNEAGKMVFSKFEFSANPAKAKKKKINHIEKNPRLLLQSIKKQQKEIKVLQEEGDTDKAEQIKKDMAWKKAFDKTEGLKVKDSTTLLHKTIKRKKIQKKKSKTEWKQREEKIQNDIEKRQKKRQENINKKKEEKKKHKLKKLSKRGRIIPGYS